MSKLPDKVAAGDEIDVQLAPRRRRLTDRELAEKYRPAYTCAGCGREFHVPDFKAETGDRRFYVVLGGRKFCSKCAAARRPRRVPGAEWAQSESCVHLPQKGAAHR